MRGADEHTARLVERRRRRAAERRRRAQRRRRNVLLLVAGSAFLVGVVAGAGAGGSPSGDDPAAAGGEVPAVTGFEGPVPILMYHAISAAPPGVPYPNLFVPQREFEQQMRWLADSGYQAVTLDEVFAAWRDGEPIDRNPIVVSFDDGLRSQHVAAFPALQRLSWPGVLNLKLESIKQGELTEEMVADLVAAGWEVDSHTFTHADATSLDAGALRHEIEGSRRELAQRFGEPVNFFAYPAGRYDREAIEAVKEAGYLGAMTTDPGFATRGRPYRLSRLRIDAGDGIAGLEAKLEGGPGG